MLWQNRLHPMAYLEAVWIKLRHDRRVINKAVYLAIYVNMNGIKEAAADFKTIYQAPTVELSDKNLEAFAVKWDASHPSIA